MPPATASTVEVDFCVLSDPSDEAERWVPVSGFAPADAVALWSRSERVTCCTLQLGFRFTEIGQKRGPIDLSLIKVGDYGDDPAWNSIHMFAEDSIQAHLDLGATTLLPIHWGTFELSFHAWDEPIQRASAAAAAKGAQMVTPRLGETCTHGEAFESVAWWEDIEE